MIQTPDWHQVSYCERAVNMVHPEEVSYCEKDFPFIYIYMIYISLNVSCTSLFNSLTPPSGLASICSLSVSLCSLSVSLCSLSVSLCSLSVSFCSLVKPLTPSRLSASIDVWPSMSVVSPYSDWCVLHRRVFSAMPTLSAVGQRNPSDWLFS